MSDNSRQEVPYFIVAAWWMLASDDTSSAKLLADCPDAALVKALDGGHNFPPGFLDTLKNFAKQPAAIAAFKTLRGIYNRMVRSSTFYTGHACQQYLQVQKTSTLNQEPPKHGKRAKGPARTAAKKSRG